MNIDKAPVSDPVYFTVLPSSAGFTDQLYQFSVFYKLGLSLGYVYLHSKFVSDRGGSEDIYEFLGFNEQFAVNKLNQKNALYRRMGTNSCLGRGSTSWMPRIKSYIRKLKYKAIGNLFFREFAFLDIGLDDATLGGREYESVEQVRDLLRTIISQNLKKYSGCKNVVRFYLVEGRYFFLKVAPLITEKVPYFQDGLDLRSAYFHHRKEDPVKSQFSESKIALQIHIRLGDTALIETPWHSYVPLWAGRSISPLKEFADQSDELFLQTMDVAEFWRFMEVFSSHFNENDLSTVIFSDGYNLAFKELFRMLDDLSLDENKINALKQSAVTYEKDKFSVFDNMKNCVRIVGENNEGLRQLVHSSLISDVIVIGCNQKMIPKFLSTYYDAQRKRPAIIISLYKDKVPAYEIKLDPGKAVVYHVNVNNLDSDETLLIAIEEIKHRAADKSILTLAPE